MIKQSRVQSIIAFTLVELLVAVSIIGLLASIVIASLNNSRQKARDSRRVADIREIRSALELYYTDVREYPDDIYAVSGSIAGKYISTVSKDTYRNTNYFYNALQNNSPTPLDCTAVTGSCHYFHLGAWMEISLPNGQNVLKSDRDLYLGVPLGSVPAGDFYGASAQCDLTAGTQAADSCYDVSP